MKKFNEFLTEEKAGKKLTHIPHVEDLMFHGGHEGVGTAAQHLDDAHNTLMGKKSTSSITTKYDGSPSVVFGQHPENGKFFVGTKAAFNRAPKISHTPEDVDKHYPDEPDLANKLKTALVHLPKIMPDKGGVYQGDLMHTKGDVKKAGGMYHFKPNTITYSASEKDDHGQRIKNSQMGIVTHTQYSGGKDIGAMTAKPLSDYKRNEFKSHVDVHHIDPSIDVNVHNYTPEDQTEFLNHKANATKSYNKVTPEAEDLMHAHKDHIQKYINKSVRTSVEPSADGFVDHLTQESKSDIANTPKNGSKDTKQKQWGARIQSVIDNKDQMKNILDTHSHLQKAKDTLVRVMGKNSPFLHSIGNQVTGPEGAVLADRHGGMSKFVDRKEFSRQNFLANKLNEEAEQEAVEQHTHVWYGRGNPITRGHQLGIEQAVSQAKKSEGVAVALFTHTHDAKNNPLTPEQKLKHAQRAFPEANPTVTDKNKSSLLHFASDAYEAGTTHFHLHVGSDQVEKFETLLNKYNGKASDEEGRPYPHGHYKFEQINVHQAGDNRDDSPVSSTAMRDAAKSGDRKLFHDLAPTTMSKKDKDEMMKDVRNGLVVKENLSITKALLESLKLIKD